jgi:Uma2 family endonuclease
MVMLSTRQLTVPPGQSLLLHDISWQDFDDILQELGQSRSTSLAYDHGTLEIMTPLPEHEYLKTVMGDIVKDVADELDQDYESYGSTTWREQAKAAGLEPDDCFYFEHEAIVRGRVDLDLKLDPPPDLALEIDATSKSLDRLLIYARLGVPEVWRYEVTPGKPFQNGKLRLYALQGDRYAEVTVSLAFPQLPIQELPTLIERYRSQGRRALRRETRDWVRRSIKPIP